MKKINIKNMKKALIVIAVFGFCLITTNQSFAKGCELKNMTEIEAENSDVLLIKNIQQTQKIVIVDIQGTTIAEKSLGKKKKISKKEKRKFDQLFKRSEFLLQTSQDIYYIYLAK
jgi:hypothetical protein